MLAVVVLGGCPRGGARAPAGPALVPWDAALETAAPGGFAGIALAPDGRVVASFQADAAASLEGSELAPPTGASGAVMLSPAGAVVWSRAFAGTGGGGVRTGVVAIAGDLAAVAIAAEGTVMLGDREVALRGSPGAAIVGLAAADGADRWVQPIGATGWVVVRAMTALPGGDLAVAGTFAGTLRAGDLVVTAGGPTDGFVARLAPTGEVRWLVRIGGEYADTITAVAADADGLDGDGLVVAGTFTSTADARGITLEPIDPESIKPDGFVARLDAAGAVLWARPFGSDTDDAVAGVAVTPSGMIGVAATIREETHVDGKTVTARGPADAALLTFDGKGGRRSVALIGGADYDSAAGLAAQGDAFVLAAAYSGEIVVGNTTLDAAGGDGAVLAILDTSGTVRRALDVTGDGRETIAALAATPAGFAAAIRHTAGLTLAPTTLPAPADPYAGAVLLTRPR